MRHRISIIEARKKLAELPELLERHPGALTVTRHGKPVLAVLHWDQYEGLLETMEILGDAEFMARLRKSVEELKAGRGILWEAAKRRLRQ
jgi:PHD/YefM family antitoxin component YafN of YafNO toxin-antitoxin module